MERMNQEFALGFIVNWLCSAQATQCRLTARWHALHSTTEEYHVTYTDENGNESYCYYCR